MLPVSSASLWSVIALIKTTSVCPYFSFQVVAPFSFFTPSRPLIFRFLMQFEDCTFDWLYWPQAQQPYSAETLAYINSLDAEKDIELLKFHGWTMSFACARVLRISTMLLKKGAERGLTPFAIGSIMCRETLKKESIIEEIVEEAEEGVLPGTSEATFLQSVSSIMDRRLDDMNK